MVVLLSGKMKVGKDEVATHLVKKHGFRQLAFADELKRVAGSLMGVEYSAGVDKDEVLKRWGKSRRQIWQELGEAVRKVHPDVWVELVLERVDLWDNVVISDGRYENEVRLAKGAGAYVVRVTRPSLVQKSTHVSETELDKYADSDPIWDAVIVNDGATGDLTKKVDDVVASFSRRSLR